ncbi:MAG TPA: hypothetical protein VHU23_03190 [Rhizomicrobium sp.]|jgi:hypothetical protein|nr:hypothetical protein [Rhizomicrobium sp.]
MARQTSYIVQAFVSGKGGQLKADKPLLCKNAEEATRKAQRMAEGKIGVVAYSNSGDPETGDYDEQPTILFNVGRLPSLFGN